jgi:hypothetical protein
MKAVAVPLLLGRVGKTERCQLSPFSLIARSSRLLRSSPFNNTSRQKVAHSSLSSFSRLAFSPPFLKQRPTRLSAIMALSHTPSSSSLLVLSLLALAASSSATSPSFGSVDPLFDSLSLETTFAAYDEDLPPPEKADYEGVDVWERSIDGAEADARWRARRRGLNRIVARSSTVACSSTSTCSASSTFVSSLPSNSHAKCNKARGYCVYGALACMSLSRSASSGVTDPFSAGKNRLRRRIHRQRLFLRPRLGFLHQDGRLHLRSHYRRRKLAPQVFQQALHLGCVAALFSLSFPFLPC